MADQPVVEYCFSAEPSWACDAIECTRTGIEFNFEKLCLLCKAADLPDKISIYLETSENGGKTVDDMASDRNKGVSKRVERPVNGVGESSTENFLMREIRAAKEREETLRLEKLEQAKLLSVAATSSAGEHKREFDSPIAETTLKGSIRVPFEKRVPPTVQSADGASAGAKLTPTSSASVTVRARAAPFLVSPQTFKSNEFTRSPHYKHEDPVQLDVRIARQREEEIRSQRVGTVTPGSLSGQQASFEAKWKAPVPQSKGDEDSLDSPVNTLSARRGSGASSNGSSSCFSGGGRRDSGTLAPVSSNSKELLVGDALLTKRVDATTHFRAAAAPSGSSDCRYVESVANGAVKLSTDATATSAELQYEAENPIQRDIRLTMEREREFRARSSAEN